MSRIFIFLLSGLLLSLLSVYQPEYVFAFNIVLLGFIIGFFCIYLSAQHDFKFLVTIFSAGYLLRIVLSIALYAYALPIKYLESKVAFEGFFIGDGWGYYTNGTLLSNLWNTGFFPDPETFRIMRYTASSTVSAYDYFNAIIIWLGGGTPLVFFFINCFLGALSIVLIYLIASRMINITTARYVSIFYCFWPSMVLWSTQNLKDPICDFMIYLSILAMTTLLKNFRPWYLLCFMFSVYTLSILRPIMGLVIGLIFIIFYLNLLLEKKYKIIFLLGGILLLVGFLVLRHFSGEILSKIVQFNSDSFIEQLSTARSVRASGGSSILPGFEYGSGLHKFLFFVPIGFAIVFLMPFPWQLGSSLQIISFPETLIWYLLFPLTVSGIVYCFKKNSFNSTIIISYVVIMGLVLGLTEGNVGTLFRHRSSIFALSFIFTAIGIEKLVQQKKRGLNDTYF